MLDLGVCKPGSTIRIPFSSFDKDDGSSITMTNYAAADILIYKDGSTTERASTSGFTATTDFDSKTGKHIAVIDLADNTTADFYASGSEYLVAIDAVTVDAVTTGGWIARFKIGYPGAVLDTTIATLASQTSFTLTVGPAEDNALNGLWAVIHDTASAVQASWVQILSYTGSTKTVTLVAGATFTVAAKDNISVMFVAPLMPTTTGRTLDVSSGGEAGVDWANVGSPTTTLSLSGTTVNTATNVTTVNGLAAGVITAAAVATGAIDADAIASDAVTEIRSLVSGTSDSGTTTTMVDAARTEADTDYWKGCYILFTSGNISGQCRLITAFNATTDTITFAPATTQAAATQNYEILVSARADVELWDGSAVNSLVSGRVDTSVGAMANDTMTAAALASDAVTEIQSGLATSTQATNIQSDTDDIQSRLPAALTAGGNIKCDALAISGDTTAADNAEAFFDGTGYAGTNNVIPTVTTVNGLAANTITATSIATDAITAAKIAADAIGASELAADAVAEIADAVWDEIASGHTTAGSFGQQSYLVRANTAQAGAGTTITLDASASAVDDFYKNCLIVITAGTGVGQSRFISGYVGSTKVATVPTWATNPSSDSVFVILPFGAIAGASAPTAAEVADAVWDEAIAGHAAAGSTGEALTNAGSSSSSARALTDGYIGDFAAGGTINFSFTTTTSNGAPVALAGSPAISIYKDNSATQTTTGITLTVNFDSVTGLNQVSIDTSADGTFYANGSDFQVVITTGTANSISMVGYEVAKFSLRNRATLYPTTAGRTLDVSAGGEAGLDWANIGSPTTAQNLSATNIDVDQVVASVSGAVGSVTGAVGSVTGNVGGNVTGSIGSVASGGITRASFAADTGLLTARSNTAQAGAAGSITLDASASATTDFYKGMEVTLTGGTGIGQSRLITAYNGTTKVATIAPNWATNPASDSTFAILNWAGVDVELWGAAAPSALISGRVDANTQATAASLTFALTGNITGNLSGSVGSVTGNVGGNVVGSVASVTGNVGGSVASVTGNVGGNVTGNVGGNVTGSVGSLATQAKADVNAEVDTAILDVGLTTTITGRIDAAVSTRATPAQVNTEVDTALVDIHLDHLIASADPGSVVADSSFLAKLVSKSATPAFSSYVNTTDSLEALRDNTGTAGAGLTSVAPAATALSTVQWTNTRAGLIDNLDATISSRSTYDGSDTAGTTTLLSRLSATRAANLDFLDIAISSRLATSGYTAPPSANSNADALLDRSNGIETSYTVRQTMRLLLAALAGKISGIGTGSVVIRDVNDTKDRITATIDGSHNRTSTSFDVS